jgi:hypothetical protein
MRVRFIGGNDSFDQRVLQGADALARGREYVVLEVFAQADGANYFRIEYSKRELPPIFDSRLFEVTSSSIPRCWGLYIVGDGSVAIRPAGWSTPGFWESLMDRDEWAIELYSSVRDDVFENSK